MEEGGTVLYEGGVEKGEGVVGEGMIMRGEEIENEFRLAAPTKYLRF